MKPVVQSAFLANISHEIRTPLGAMLGFTELVLDDKSLTPAQIQYLSTVERNGRQLLRLVDEILDLSKVESEHIQIDKTTFELKELVNDVTTSLNLKANEKGLLLNTTYENASDSGIISDPSRLRQIMVNVIGNAIKFTDRGHIDVRVSLVKKQDQSDGLVSIEVEDSGIGIDPKQAEVLFKPFVQGDESMTRRFGGTGLGLFLSRKLAQLMGGDVTLASSQPDHGSCFKIEILVGLAENKVSENVPIRNKPTLNSKQSRVLIVDDAIDNRLLLEMLLKKYQVETVSASNGQEAVQAALSSHFDLVLMDVQMPVMDGFEAVKQLRDQNYTQPVIALTAHAMRGDRERCIEKGFDDYIQKPINRQTLETCLTHYLSYPTTPEPKY
jgi:CheY-like chemotaxis protein/anti-sigma regulatory factor (Ser/Thr protein kinase)